MRYLATVYPSLNKYYPNTSPESKAHIDIGTDFCGTVLRPTSASTFVPIIFARFSGEEPTEKMLDNAAEGEKKL